MFIWHCITHNGQANHATPLRPVVNILYCLEWLFWFLAISTFIVMIMIVECSLYWWIWSECIYFYIRLKLNSMAPIKDPNIHKTRQIEMEKSNNLHLQTRKKNKTKKVTWVAVFTICLQYLLVFLVNVGKKGLKKLQIGLTIWNLIKMVMTNHWINKKNSKNQSKSQPHIKYWQYTNKDTFTE